MGSFLTLGESVRIPSNTEAAADSLIGRYLGILGRLGMSIEESSESISIPDEFSEGWVSNISIILDTLSNLISTLHPNQDGNVAHIPRSLKHHGCFQLLKIFINRCASKYNLDAFLLKEYKNPINVTQWLDLLQGYGTPIKGNICQSMASSIFNLICALAHKEEAIKSLPTSIFLSGSDLKYQSFPKLRLSITKVEKKKKVTEKIAKPLNIFRPDEVRFLLPQERAQIRSNVPVLGLEEKIRSFDRMQMFERQGNFSYQSIQMSIIESIDFMQPIYYRIRRAAKGRLQVIKAIRKECKLIETVEDGEFTNTSMLETLKTLAESALVDLGKRKSLIEALFRPMPYSSPSGFTEEEKQKTATCLQEAIEHMESLRLSGQKVEKPTYLSLTTASNYKDLRNRKIPMVKKK
jgi:hypothetical protein